MVAEAVAPALVNVEKVQEVLTVKAVALHGSSFGCAKQYGTLIRMKNSRARVFNNFVRAIIIWFYFL